ncbi:MAG: hypothetical protein ACI9S8_001752 [Chlamydiales bacterium]
MGPNENSSDVPSFRILVEKQIVADVQSKNAKSRNSYNPCLLYCESIFHYQKTRLPSFPEFDCEKNITYFKKPLTSVNISTKIKGHEMTISTIVSPVTSAMGMRPYHSVSGNLKHPNGDPMTHQKVKVFSQHCFGRNSLGSFHTDREGNFDFKYRRFRLRMDRNDSLIFRVIEETLDLKSGCLPCCQKTIERAVHETILIKPASTRHYNAGTVEAELYEYQPGFPDLLQPDNADHRPQQWPPAYHATLVKAGWDEKVKDLLVGLGGSRVSVSDLEKLYGVYNPELQLTPETTVELLLNGIYPCNFLNGDHPGEYVVDINWDRYQLDSGPRPELPNVSLRMDKTNDKLNIQNITVQFRGEEAETFQINGPNFDKALYLFNSMALVKGEIVSHLGLGHLYSGQAAMAVFRTLNENPLENLLKPHLRGVLEINRMGATDIFGPEGILNVSGLSVDGILESLKDVLAGTCYSNFTPRVPVCEDHRFAKAENLYWDVVGRVVDRFFGENETGIQDNWHEIFYLSKTLVEHSLPYAPWERKDFQAWNDPREIDDPSHPGRVMFENELRAIRPITSSSSSPQEGDMERLKQFTRHALFMVTFWHWAVHSTQGKWGTNLKIAALAPRKPVDMPYGGVQVKDANHQLKVAHVFAGFERGFLLNNPHGDIYPPMMQELQKKKADFKSLGYDLRKLPYGTNI